jgi:Fur family transcriptional regulator, ferric uptake regulator
MSRTEDTRPALGQRQTRQRDRIFHVIRDAQGPLTVQEILERAQMDLPGLGIATVYRTVNLLQQSRLISTVILPTGETRFELSGLGHHHHFQCRSCQEVFDLEHCPVTIPHQPLANDGFVVESHDLTLYGLCPACAAA